MHSVWFLALLALPAYVLSAGQFIMTRCGCDANSLAQSYILKFFTEDVTEATVNVQLGCQGENKPSQCVGFALANNCQDTGIGGIGELCYQVGLPLPDMFSINGHGFNQSNFPHHENKDLFGSDFCRSLCLGNLGLAPASFDDGSNFQLTIDDVLEPQATT